MSNRVITAEQKAKLNQLFNEGISVLTEIEDLNAGLNDTIKAIAEEMEIKPAVLKKAIKIAKKSEFSKETEDHELLETILTTVGRTV